MRSAAGAKPAAGRGAAPSSPEAFVRIGVSTCLLGERVRLRKRGSPRCGMERVKGSGRSGPVASSRGLCADALRQVAHAWGSKGPP